MSRTPTTNNLTDDRAAKLFSHKYYLVLVCLVALAYLALAVCNARTRSPWSDEAWFANAALNLITKGHMATTVLETAGTNLKGLDQYTYWVMPLHLLTQAAWYKVFGFSLFAMRMLSTAWGAVALVSWYFIIKSLSGERKVALLTFILLALDYVFIMAASFGRMDMMSAALGSAALAAYLLLRERDLKLAIFLGQSLVTACGLTHPNGGVLFFVGLLFLILYFDRARLKWQHLMIAGIPYVIGAAAWSTYILRAPSLFVSQLTANAAMGGRMSGLTSPLSALKNEITLRYLTAYGLGQHTSGHLGPVQLKALVLVAYLIAIIGVLSVRAIRQHKGYRALLMLTAIYFIILTFFDGQKMSFYLVHIIPLYTAILAVWINWCWSRRLLPRWLVALAVCGLVALQVGGVLYRVKVNAYRNSYMAAVDVVKQNAKPDTLVMGSAILGFELGFDHVLDDVRLGLYSGKRPDLIVIGEPYEEALKEYEAHQTVEWQHIQRLLAEDYREVYDHELYRIYVRR
ncbi:MAG TPA: glycosyltransferase family 39 protein [Pyrinomonadaceae bacterium]|jgi:4-amino-4-deoxy-L-arabinose transferase-like glycosyltransferase|nr:glycosyltransferase family 39 protein [Pyrinomonadaceae bacterium]